jgi:hypothetical protein
MEVPQKCKFPGCLNTALPGIDFCLIHSGNRIGIIGKDITLATNLEIQRRTPFKEAATNLSTRTELNVPLQSIGVMILDPNKYRIPLGWEVPKVQKTYIHTVAQLPTPIATTPIAAQTVHVGTQLNIIKPRIITINPTLPIQRKLTGGTGPIIVPTIPIIRTGPVPIAATGLKPTIPIIQVKNPKVAPAHNTIKTIPGNGINVGVKTTNLTLGTQQNAPKVPGITTLRQTTTNRIKSPVVQNLVPVNINTLHPPIGAKELRQKVDAGRTPIKITKPGVDAAFVEQMLDEVIGEQDSDIQQEKDYLGIINGLLENQPKSKIFSEIHPEWMILQSIRIDDQGLTANKSTLPDWYEFGGEGGIVSVKRGTLASIFDNVMIATVEANKGIGMIVSYDRHANAIWFQMDTTGSLNIWRYEPGSGFLDGEQHIIDSCLRGFFSALFEINNVKITYHPHRLQPEWQVQGHRGANRLYKSDYFCEDYSILYIENRAAGMDHEAAAFELVTEGEDILVRLRRLLREMTEYAKNNY